ncbi:hypothetical protein L1987_12922 [Smallanthus sonchifolius]|uniref:Uncharacterized protein n=1 Tax=Smallanthus sonchifolius TaxID=185202 RepID=A0ACB9JF55_9ASTR|nr:hypothetical protein L1987_12922 [Smallanthus sonchifolius]
MQSEFLIQTTWPIQSCFHSYIDYYESTPENSMISSLGYDQMQNPSLVYSDPQNISTLEDVCRWLCDDDDQETEEIQFIVTLGDVMEESDDVTEPESQTGLQNLLTAYADGISMGQIELAKPPFIQAIARIKKSLIITSFKLDQDQDSQFDQTKMNLCNFARSFGLHLTVQEMGMTQMMTQTDQANLTGEFMAFNCMVDIPHMGITRTTTQVMNFLKIAKRVLSKTKGIITFADGEEGTRTGNYSNFSSFFNKNLAHYNALYESMEWGFPSHFNEGRMAETLFISPFINSKSWIKKWEEGNENMGLWKVLGLKGVKMSEEWWNEARELVKEGESHMGLGLETMGMKWYWNGKELHW